MISDQAYVWGRRVIVQRLLHRSGSQVDTAELDELTYLLESGSDRIGALDFQLSATEYIPRLGHNASLDQLLEAIEKHWQDVAEEAALPTKDRELFRQRLLLPDGIYD